MDDEPITIAVIDDHPLVRAGIVHAIDGTEGLRVIAQGATAQDALDIARTQVPDILVLDLSIPGGGLAALRSIMEAGAPCKVIILTVVEDAAIILESFRLGARGYALKGISGTELTQALGAIHRNGSYISPELGAKILADISRNQNVAEPEKPGTLNSREATIHSLIRRGFSNKEIGKELNLSEKTVKYNLTKLFKKLSVRNRLELAMLVQGDGSEALDPSR